MGRTAMGEVVAAILTTHVPRLMIHDLEARRAYMGRQISTFYEAMERVERERLQALPFDTFVLFDTHWFTTVRMTTRAIPTSRTRSSLRHGGTACAPLHRAIGTCRSTIRRST